MALTSAAPLAPAPAPTDAATSAAALAENFDTFLLLLTEQLQNQDPLDPLDSNEFVGQLVEFTGVEQAINTNTNLETLIDLQTAAAGQTAIQLLGQSVTVPGDTALLGPTGSTSFDFALESPAAQVELQVFNSEGLLVFEGLADPNITENTFVFNGLDENGERLPPGEYSLSVNATDAFGAPIPVSQSITDQVVGVDLTASPALLTLTGDRTVALSDVQSVNAFGAAGPNAPNPFFQPVPTGVIPPADADPETETDLAADEPDTEEPLPEVV
ncbi:MAG: flagellar hook assembly protein FlgD [Maricaulaceae bacterium]